VTIAGNPVLSAPNGSRLDRALATLDHMVAIDPYLNETTRHAHVLLPPAPPLARAHYPLAVYAFSVRNVARFADPVVAPAAGERHDWEIVTGLGARLFAPRPARHLVARAAGLLRPERLVEILLRVGPHRLRLADLRSAAHGMDLGPLEPGVLARRIATGDGRVNAAPDDFVREAAERLPAEADAGGDDRLVLIGRRHLRTNNSWMHHVPRLANGGARCTLLIHPLDAASLGLDDGASARLESDAGCVVAPVECSDTIRRGVVSLPHGWGHASSGRRLRDAAGSPGVSLNAVTSEHRVDHVSGNAAFNGIPVRVMPE
jgi:anaerobic selenocysteine-containing dehydrogenase